MVNWKLVKLGSCSVTYFAVSELKKYMNMIDPDNEYIIMSFKEFDPSLSDALWIGQSEKFSLPEVKDKSFDDGVSIEVHGKSGYITGTNPRSVLIAVYRFLRELGCAFIRPGKDGEVIPNRSLESVDVSVFEAASYRHRGVCIEGAVSAEHVLRNIEWMPKIGMNAFFNQFQIPFTFYDRWYSHHYNPVYEKEPFSLKDAEGIMNASIDEIKKRGLMYHATGHGWTCEPFGLEGSEWEEKEHIPEKTKECLALVNGKRELWGGVPLNTNLCYSSDYVKETMANAVADYCIRYPQVDVLHVWLADENNNHCECEKCINRRPADLYIELLNRIDEILTERKIDTKIVFLIYLDLIWEPVETELNNPERFILMFAPITRTYTHSLADAESFDMEKLAPYVKNKAEFPKNVSENLARLFKWQEHFKGDSFIYDYHFMWDHFLDPGYSQMAKILFKDMKHLDKYNINGMISCQNQRVFFPTGLGMVAMAEALWNKELSFEDVAEKYYSDAFGPDGKAVMEYLSELSELFTPPYLRVECEIVNEETAKKYARIPATVNEFKLKIEEQLEKDELLSSQRKSWEYLIEHGEYCKLLAKVFEYTSQGDLKNADNSFENVMDYIRNNEYKLHNVFDLCLFYRTFSFRLNRMKEKVANFSEK